MKKALPVPVLALVAVLATAVVVSPAGAQVDMPLTNGCANEVVLEGSSPVLAGNELYTRAGGDSFNRYEVANGQIEQVDPIDAFPASAPDGAYTSNRAHSDSLTVVVEAVFPEDLVIYATQHSSGLSRTVSLPDGYTLSVDSEFFDGGIGVLGGSQFAVSAFDDAVGDPVVVVFDYTAVSTTFFWQPTVLSLSAFAGSSIAEVLLFDESVWGVRWGKFEVYDFESAESNVVVPSSSSHSEFERDGDYVMFFNHGEDIFGRAEVFRSNGELVLSTWFGNSRIDGERAADLALDYDGARYRILALSKNNAVYSLDLGTKESPVTDAEFEEVFNLSGLGVAPSDGYYVTSSIQASGGKVFVDADTRTFLGTGGACVSLIPVPDSAVSNPAPFDPSGTAGPGNDASFPECVAQINGPGYCFEAASSSGSPSPRDLYIENQLIGYPEYGDIWIGRFDQEVVAP